VTPIAALAILAFALEDTAAANAGVIDIIPGSGHGLRLGASRQLDQATPGVADKPEPGDFLGLTLAPPDGSALINVFD
jgi:hypothetical protein